MQNQNGDDKNANKTCSDHFLGDIQPDTFFGHSGFFSGKIREYGVKST
jgi:hypothetical protein